MLYFENFYNRLNEYLFLDKVVLWVHVLLVLVGAVVLFHLSDKKILMNLFKMFVKNFILIVKIPNESTKLTKVFSQHYLVVEFMPFDYNKLLIDDFVFCYALVISFFS